MFPNKAQIKMRLFIEPDRFLEVRSKCCLIHMRLLEVDTKEVGGVLGNDLDDQQELEVSLLEYLLDSSKPLLFSNAIPRHRR